MGVIVYCLGCGHGHDNLWSCERARVERERSACLVADVAKIPVEKTVGPTQSPAELYLASEARTHAAGRKRGSSVVKPKPSVPGADLDIRLAATEKRLAEIREKERVKKAKWRDKQKVPPPV